MRKQCNSAYSRRRLMPTILAAVACGLLTACESASTAPPSVGASVACQVPGRCGEALACEGRQISVTGRIDAINIFDNASHPQLTVQKFFVRPLRSAEAVEIWVESASPSAAAEIFRRVRAAAAAQTDVSVTGKAVGVDLHITGYCHRMFKLHIDAANAIATGANTATGGYAK